MSAPTAKSPALTKGQRANFETLKLAAKNGDLALLSCTDKATGKPRGCHRRAIHTTS